ncbi:ABC transporter permease [Acidihalobacter ferrooxydans]|uniref:ABC transmembrane type-1 domain-containing protein n=1 Tax=Acidihalobacter ferrooxydans TaxID=1765967 RepID=A0A1P8ULC1_9GAMM|nr:ABC transporter permease subunit [Acidihalobacter ferrooxydans]APZ44602.1 hypothetical protein BW247_07370 [Acidihalobacter ferrooxydans]
MPARRLVAAVPVAVVGLGALASWPALTVLANYSAAQAALAAGGCHGLYACASTLSDPILPAPGQFFRGAMNMLHPWWGTSSLLYNMLYTGWETLLGLLLALVVAFFTGTLLAFSKPFERATLPWIVASQNVPIIALAPVLVVLLGRFGVEGLLPKALISGYIAFFALTVGVARGLASLDPLRLDLMRSYCASPWFVYWHVRLPVALPMIMTNLKVAAAGALVGAIVAELSTVTFSGLGAMLLARYYAGDIVGLWVVMIASGVLGIALYALLSLLERVVTPWSPRR